MTRMLLIAASGLDWAGFDAHTRAQTLPALSGLRQRGVAGVLAGAPASLGPAATVSLVTGVQPAVHGVWREEEAWPGGLRPTGKTSWRVQPVWARLEAAGVSTAGVGWAATAPGADWAGVHIDERFYEMTGRTAADWALPRRCAPDELRDELGGRRVHISQITGDMLAPLIPGLLDINDPRDNAVATAALGMSQASTIQAAAVWLLNPARLDAVFIRHPWVGQIRQAFERRPGPMFSEAVPAAWRFLDAMVGTLADLAGPEALVLVVSPGWKSSPGVVLAAGPGVTQDPEFTGAGLLDIAPTVLGRFGLIDPALPGRRLAFVASAASEPSPAPSPPIPAPEKADPAMIYALRKHGYRPPPRPSRTWQAQGLAELARMTLDRDPAGAVRLAGAALFKSPGLVLALRVKTRGHVALGQADPLPALGDALTEAAPDRGWGALAHGAYHVIRGEKVLATPWLRKAEADTDVATLLTAAAVWLGAGRAASAERVFAKVLELDPANVTASIGIAMGAVARRDFLAAELRLTQALKLDPGRPAIYLQLAQTYARTARKFEAGRAADKAISLGAHPRLAAAARAGRLRG